MRFTRALSLLVVPCLLFASCAGAPPPAGSKQPSPRADSTPPGAEPNESTGVLGREAPDQEGSSPAAQGAGTKGDPPPAAVEVAAESPCPPEMVYVEGEFCTDESNDQAPDQYGNTPGAGARDIEAVARECLREWYAPQNKKRVCELFSEAAQCTGKMVKKRFCIDRYAWPNVRGHKPEVMNRFHQAQIKCAAAGKRLCTESEWTMSCEGPQMLPFPYGVERDAKKCHGDEEWDSPNMDKAAARDPEELRRLYKGKPSGQAECKSDYGVYDLPGNTDEIVASETFEKGWRGKYDSVHTGGPWYKGVRNQCRPKIYTHDEGFYYYFLSFRCCADAGAAEVDPLTPKQKREGWDLARVERIAGITVEEMQELLEKKKSDPTCGCTTTRCRTFCGTLHGDPGTESDSWDAPLGNKAGNGMSRGRRSTGKATQE